MKVNECMCHDVLWVNPGTSVCDCANLMAEHKIGCLPVCDANQKVVGLITDRDILLRTVCQNKNVKATPVSDIMTTNVCCCGSEEHIDTAQKLMSNNQIRRLPIIENDKIVGILSIGDISRNPNTDKESFIITFDNICKSGNKNNS
ncbi:MAG: CBS domain-containing protein [Clostridia bacterium]|nr:CBS domain-containing protein [Clostridia bacterium]